MAIKSLIPSLLVDSIDDTVNYYTEILGFKLERKNPYWAHLRWEAAHLYLTLKNSVIGFLPEMKNKTLGGTFTLYISVDEIDEYYNRVKDLVCVSMPLHTTDYGTKEFQVRDINGYILDFGQTT
jgi:lactoylglutathione lyase